MVRKLAFSVLFFSILNYAPPVIAKTEIRFYKVNKFEQTDRVRFTRKKGRTPGCHNFLKKTRVFKVVQFQFEACTLYLEKECKVGSELMVTHAKDETPTAILTQGYGWLTTPPEEQANKDKNVRKQKLQRSQRGAKIRSWHCQ